MLRVNPATAWLLLEQAKAGTRGGWVVQNAASSNLGVCLRQLAGRWGLRMINLVRRRECLGEGEFFLDDGEAVAAVERLVGGEAPGWAINAVGGESAGRLLRMLAPGGTMVTVGAMGRQPVKVSNGLLIFKGVRLEGFWLTRWLEGRDPVKVREMYGVLAGLAARGVLQQPVAGRYGLGEIHEALAHAAEGGREGKVMLALGE